MSIDLVICQVLIVQTVKVHPRHDGMTFLWKGMNKNTVAVILGDLAKDTKQKTDKWLNNKLGYTCKKSTCAFSKYPCS